MAKINFGSVAKPGSVYYRGLGGPGYKRRVAFYRNYLPMAVARRLARRFTITPGSAGYKGSLIDKLKVEWNEHIVKRMRFEKETREQAIRGVWEKYYKIFHLSNISATGEVEYSQKQFMHDWLGDVLESP